MWRQTLIGVCLALSCGSSCSSLDADEAYDTQGCADTLRDQVCSPAADAVQSGFAVYDDSAAPACLAAHVKANARM